MDLIAKYRWRNIEASASIRNLTNTDWRQAQFSDTSCVRSEVGTAVGCSARPGKQTAQAEDPRDDIHCTPGNPIGVIGGIKVFF